MKLQAQSSRALSEALSLASKCIASKNMLAILNKCLLTQRDGKFFFTTSTSDSQLTIPAPLTLLDGKYDASLALPVGGIITYLSTLPDCVVTITFNDNQTLALDYCTGSDDKVKEGKVMLFYEHGDEFPLMAPMSGDENIHICLPVDFFNRALSVARNFVADDELRPVMNTLCVDVTPDLSECVCVASNGHKLMRFTHTNNPATGGSDFIRSNTPGKMLIFSQFFKTLSAFSACETVDIESNGVFIRFTSGDIEFICKALEGKYPNYNVVIPKDNPYYAVIDKKEMLQVIKRVSIFGNTTTNLLRVAKSGMFLDVSAEDIVVSTSAKDQVILNDAQCPDGFAIGLAATTLTAAISAIEGNDLLMKFAAPSRAVIFTGNTPNPTELTLIMPMLLNP